MMIGTTRKALTYAEYEKLPEGTRAQLIDGELVMSPSPTPYHQTILGRINVVFREYIEARNLGVVFFAPLDVYLGETEVYQPDLLYISNERLGIIGETKIEGAPDLVVEILSPTTAYYDLKHKKEIYASTGVKEYWIVDPIEKSVEVFENEGGEFRRAVRALRQGVVSSKLLKELQVSLDRLF
jgi:Uma2 family endonuclease